MTLDVSSLYTNIPYDQGLEACSEALNTRKYLSPPKEGHYQFDVVYINENHFCFWWPALFAGPRNRNGQYRMAPSYANLFTGTLERDLLNYNTNTPSIKWRCIDDIFSIWPHSERNLQIFLNELNSFHVTIKFTAEGSGETVTFLDTRVIYNDVPLMTDLYTKPTDTHQVSCHPSHCKKSIAYSQALRLRGICQEHCRF